MPSRPIAAITLKRRSLLKAAVAASGALLAAPFALRATRSDQRTVGLLLPSSQLYPQLGAQLLAGLQHALADRSQAIRLLVTEYGTLPSAAVAAGRRLVEEQGAAILVGTLSSAASGQLRPLLETRQVPLIATTAGANVSRPGSASPYLFRHTLGYWQASHASGQWAAANIGRRAFVAASFHDSGYDALDAFRIGLTQGGGQVIGTQVTHRPSDDPSLAPLMAQIAAAHPDLVYAAYTGAQGAAFLRAYADAGLHTRIPLIGSGMLALGQRAVSDMGVISALGWSPDQPAADLPIDPFATLGYDTGILIRSAFNSAPTTGGPLRDALAELDPTDGSFGSPLYLRETRWAGGSPSDRVIGALSATPAMAQHAAALRADLKTGWLHAYLCV